MVYMNRIYSGKYYSYKSCTGNEFSAVRTQLHYRYWRDYIIMVSGLFIFYIGGAYLSNALISIPHGWFATFHQLWTLWAPTVIIVIILGLTVSLIRCLARLKDIAYIHKILLSYPWVIGEVPDGYLSINLDLDETALSQVTEDRVKELLSSIERIPDGRKVLMSLIQIGPHSKTNPDKVKSEEQFLYILALCEIILEQSEAGNRSFFMDDAPLDSYKKICHSL